MSVRSRFALALVVAFAVALALPDISAGRPRGRPGGSSGSRPGSGGGSSIRPGSGGSVNRPSPRPRPDVSGVTASGRSWHAEVKTLSARDQRAVAKEAWQDAATRVGGGKPSAADLHEVRALATTQHLLSRPEAEHLGRVQAGMEVRAFRGVLAGEREVVLPTDPRHLSAEQTALTARYVKATGVVVKVAALAVLSEKPADHAKAGELAEGPLKTDLIASGRMVELKSALTADPARFADALKGVAAVVGREATASLAVKVSAAALASGKATEAVKLLPKDASPDQAAAVLRDLKALILAPADGKVPPDAKGSDAANPRGPPDGLRALIPEEARGALAAVRESALADLPSLKVTELDKPHADVLARIGPAVNALKRTTAADRNAAFAAAKAAQDKTDAYLRWYTSAVAVRRHPFPLSARDVLDVEGAALTGVPVEEFTLSGTPGLEPFGAVVGGTVFVRPVAAGPAVELGFVPRELVRVAVRRAAGKDGATADGVLEAVRGGWAKGGPTAADIALALADVIDELCYARPDPTIFSVATDGTVTFTDWDGKARSLRPTSPVPDPVDGAGGDEPRQTGGEFDPRPDTSFDPRNPPPVPVPAEVKPIEQSGPAGYEWLDLSERDAGGRRVDQALLAASTTLSKLRPDLPQADPSVAAAVAALGKIDLPFGDAVKAVAVLSAKPEPRK